MVRYFGIILILLSGIFFGCSTGNNKTSEPNTMMNPTLETIFGRRSVRHFEDRAVSADTMLLLVRAAMAAPTGMDVRPWQIIVIDDPKILDRLADSLPYAKMANQVYNGIVICGEHGVSHHWAVDCAAATENLLLAAHSMGLGAVWTALYPNEDRIRAAREILGIPDNMTPLNFIPVGYPTGEDKPKDKFDTTKIHQNRW